MICTGTALRFPTLVLRIPHVLIFYDTPRYCCCCCCCCCCCFVTPLLLLQGSLVAWALRPFSDAGTAPATGVAGDGERLAPPPLRAVGAALPGFRRPHGRLFGRRLARRLQGGSFGGGGGGRGARSSAAVAVRGLRGPEAIV